MKIAFGSDHAGYEDPGPHFKPALMAYLEELGHEVIDCGTDGADSVDYPDFGQAVSDAVLSGRAERGVLLCGTGIGISIAANRNPGIRAAVCCSEEMAHLAREHNDANVLCLGKRTTPLDQCKKLIEIWLATPFSGNERHQRRLDKLG
jgi:ribose 5-phosphate isomerase B